MCRNPGEYTLSRISIEVFDAWAKDHPDYKHKIQYHDGLVVVNVMSAIHDAAAGAIMGQLRDKTVSLTAGTCRISTRTGRILINCQPF
jgi:hypothetical protein